MMQQEILRIIIGFLTVLVFGGLLGVGLTLASAKFKVEKDKKTSDLNQALPGINCGACGYAGCSGYAEALASGTDEDIKKCKPGGQATLEQIAAVLELDVSEPGVKKVAKVHCMGGREEAKNKFQYHDLDDCRSAYSRFNGPKSCEYGCLGLGSCIKVCPVNAISIASNGLAVVDKELCISCEKCIAICPTGVLKMIPYDTDYYIACNSKDKAKITKNHCSVGCIGCKICEKKFPEAGFTIIDNLSVIDYDNIDRSPDREGAAEKCPAKCILET